LQAGGRSSHDPSSPTASLLHMSGKMDAPCTGASQGDEGAAPAMGPTVFPGPSLSSRSPLRLSSAKQPQELEIAAAWPPCVGVEQAASVEIRLLASCSRVFATQAQPETSMAGFSPDPHVSFSSPSPLHPGAAASASTSSAEACGGATVALLPASSVMTPHAARPGTPGPTPLAHSILSSAPDGDHAGMRKVQGDREAAGCMARVLLVAHDSVLSSEDIQVGNLKGHTSAR
jgi:hypothetical protein